MTNLSLPQNVMTLIEAYTDAVDKIRQGYALLEEAQAMLRTSFGNRGCFDPITQHARYGRATRAENAITAINTAAWQAIIGIAGLPQYFSIKRAKEIERNAEEDNFPPLTYATYQDFFHLVMDNFNELIYDMIKEVFEEFRVNKNKRPTGEGAYKTNQKNATYNLGEKIIITDVSISDKWFTSYKVNHYREAPLVALDKVFHLLDGKPFETSYISPLVDALNTAEGKQVDTPYFIAQIYKNGNLHLQFKRMDILTRINAIGGDGSLKG